MTTLSPPLPFGFLCELEKQWWWYSAPHPLGSVASSFFYADVHNPTTRTTDAGRVSINDALWVCQNMFSDVKVRTAGRRVLLFTNEDEPHASDDDAKKQAVTKAKDLREVGININLINMAKAGACAVCMCSAG